MIVHRHRYLHSTKRTSAKPAAALISFLCAGSASDPAPSGPAAWRFIAQLLFSAAKPELSWLQDIVAENHNCELTQIKPAFPNQAVLAAFA
jgi:hypothetical protein